MRLFQRSEIDDKQWNDCVNRSSTRQTAVFGLTWYLDVVSPGWKALVDGNYKSVFPVPIKQNPKRIIQPIFSRECGMYGDELPSQQALFELSRIARFCKIGWSGEKPKEGFASNQRIYQQLDISSGIGAVRNGYSDNVKRLLKRAAGVGLSVDNNVTPEQIVSLFIAEKGIGITSLKKRHYIVLIKLIHESLNNELGKAFSVRNKQELVAAGFFIGFGNRLLYLKGAVNAEGKKTGAMQLVFDAAIASYAGQMQYLDFGGSNNPGLAAFNRKFGAVDMPYWLISKNDFDWPLKQLAKKKWG
jgi:hypothetical protein